jgi:hypothetical protein
MKRIRDILIMLAWGVVSGVAADAWRAAHRAGNSVTELAALVWMVAMVIGGLVVLIVYFRVRRWNRRFESNQCPVCGYDLRASPDRCPECGNEVTSAETRSLPAWLNATALEFARTRSNRPRK